jgi:hypothetical protein
MATGKEQVLTIRGYLKPSLKRLALLRLQVGSDTPQGHKRPKKTLHLDIVLLLQFLLHLG